ncbi:hypothetical protein L6164_019489 [Bauhinia variegata]|uniref:Uncharacterized protein n=1 Tax=Bauhinia variegata TaxID=167791 RepID=A0ACB9MRY2_BAUVA|nr:hypothetical protein L6164_019489 [Bauhinia variegata]
MTFSGTQQKCKACDKTVHFVDTLSADGAVYHKTCFKCSHCNGQLAISTYFSMDGVLYCKPHFEQLFKETGNLTKKFQTAGMRQSDQLARAPSKLSAFFSGTQDKCSSCKKTVYPLEKITVEGEFYHKSCFRCAHGGCFLNASSYAALDGFVYCKHHFAQLFKEKGSYSYLSKAASMRKNELQQAAENAESESESKPSEAETTKEGEEEAAQDQ